MGNSYSLADKERMDKEKMDKEMKEKQWAIDKAKRNYFLCRKVEEGHMVTAEYFVKIANQQNKDGDRLDAIRNYELVVAHYTLSIHNPQFMNNNNVAYKAVLKEFEDRKMCIQFYKERIAQLKSTAWRLSYQLHGGCPNITCIYELHKYVNNIR